MNEKILCFALISDRLAHQAWETNPPKAFEGDVPYVLEKLYEEHAVDLGVERTWINKRFATNAKVLGEEVGIDQAVDLLLILDEAHRTIPQNQMEKRTASLKTSVHHFYGKDFYSSYFLRDIYVGSDSLRNKLSADPTHDYMVKLAQIWREHLDLGLDSLAESPNQVILINGQPNVTPTVTLQRVADIEKSALEKTNLVYKIPVVSL